MLPQRSLDQSAWLGAASEVTWLVWSPHLSHCWCSQSEWPQCTFSQSSRQVFHMQASLTAASSSQGFHTSTCGPARHPRATHIWKPSPGTTAGCAPLPLSTGQGCQAQQQGADHQPGGQWGRSWGSDRQKVRSDRAALCPTLQAAVQSILTCSLRQEKSRSAASALSRLYSKGEPTHITGDIHTLGRWIDRL